MNNKHPGYASLYTAKIPLWIAFLPYSFFILFIITTKKWSKIGHIGFDKEWTVTSFLIFISAFLSLLLVGIPLVLLLDSPLFDSKSTLIIVFGLFSLYICNIVISLVIREVEYRRRVRLLDKDLGMTEDK